MKKLLYILPIAVVLCLNSCSNNENYDEVPQSIIEFITQYWPSPIIENYTHPNDNEYNVTIKNGPSIEFDGDYSWTEADGNGLELPQVFLYDQLPSKLYEYLESMEYLNEVFKVERTPRTYTLELLNTEIYYDIATGAVSGRQQS